MGDSMSQAMYNSILRLEEQSNKNSTKINNLIDREYRNNESMKAVQEDINQLYLLFNELIRSNKKDKDDG